MDSDRGDGSGSGALEKLASKLGGFLSDLRGIQTQQYLLSLTQLCHADTQLAYDLWVHLFPQLWGVLSERQRQVSGSVGFVFGCNPVPYSTVLRARGDFF